MKVKAHLVEVKALKEKLNEYETWHKIDKQKILILVKRAEAAMAEVDELKKIVREIKTYAWICACQNSRPYAHKYRS